MQRTYRTFHWKDSNLRICSPAYEAATREVVEQRSRLEHYIGRHPAFLRSLVPLPLLRDAPVVARRMHAAAELVGVGPMAAVAGCLAQLAAEAALRAGAPEAIVENGGDLFAVSKARVLIAVHAGHDHALSNLAFVLEPEDMPVAICSSSSRMGHSASFGSCELATVVGEQAAVADAAATLAGNLVRDVSDIDVVLARVNAIPGVRGVLLVKADRVGLVGALPKLVRNRDDATDGKVTRDPRSPDRP